MGVGVWSIVLRVGRVHGTGTSEQVRRRLLITFNNSLLPMRKSPCFNMIIDCLLFLSYYPSPHFSPLLLGLLFSQDSFASPPTCIPPPTSREERIRWSGQREGPGEKASQVGRLGKGVRGHSHSKLPPGLGPQVSHGPRSPGL
jgi:hypothetical protein